MTFPFKSICKIEEHPDATTNNDNSSNEITDVVLSTSGRTTTTTNSVADTASTAADVVVIVAAPGRKKRFMMIDETKLPKEEAERLMIKRAYNRECAERARKRSKETVQDLQRQVEELQADKCELRNALAHMEKELQRLKDKNKALMLSRLTPGTNIYAHHNIGTNSSGSVDYVSPLNSYHKQVTALSVLQQSMDNGSHPNLGSLLPSWDLNKLLLLQRTRGRQH